MKLYKSKVLGTGAYQPKKVLTNIDLEKMVETNDQWIFERTGIRERRISSPDGGEFPTDMAYYATLEALKNANLQVNDIDFIIFGTTTPDYKLPNSSSLLQTKLGITNCCACLDIAAACTGFVYGVNMANSMIQTGMMKNVLIIGSEMLSREIDWSDRGTCILFGDGCGVAILGRGQEGESSEILSTVLAADGTGQDFFHQKPGGAISPLTKETVDDPIRYMKMQGKEMFKVAVRTLADNALLAIQKAGLTLDDIDWFVPHQANLRIIEATGKRLGISPEKVVVNIEKYANTSAATVPMAFHEAILDKRIKRGQIVLFDAFGAGLTSGATVLRY